MLAVSLLVALLLTLRLVQPEPPVEPEATEAAGASREEKGAPPSAPAVAPDPRMEDVSRAADRMRGIDWDRVQQADLEALPPALRVLGLPDEAIWMGLNALLQSHAPPGLLPLAEEETPSEDPRLSEEARLLANARFIERQEAIDALMTGGSGAMSSVRQRHLQAAYGSMPSPQLRRIERERLELLTARRATAQQAAGDRSRSEASDLAAAVETFLTPPEFDEFRLRQTTGGSLQRNRLAVVEASRDERLLLLEAYEDFLRAQNEPVAGARQGAELNLLRAERAVLGDERMAQLLASTDRRYRQFREEVLPHPEETPLPQQLDLLEAMLGIAKEHTRLYGTLVEQPEAYAEAYVELLRRGEREIIRLGGAEVWDNYRRSGLGRWTRPDD
ncbi:MAG: hypothetical protein EA425_07615 [Puniceicoccaceae bacterium]|nr:MAG: hypothetical protein EA425_07615 [Puniceicoccaceae bacterium]